MEHNVEAFLKKYENSTKEEAIYEMFKSNCDLQQRIDKAIIKIVTISSDDLKDIKIIVKKLKDIKSILQGEKVKDNEL